jgi:hypothetical protein
MRLTRFWFKLKDDGKLPPGIIMGCGITAFGIQDAKEILLKKVFSNEPLEIEELKENIDLSTLDANHILTNMLPPNVRGIWFPLGYE